MEQKGARAPQPGFRPLARRLLLFDFPFDKCEQNEIKVMPLWHHFGIIAVNAGTLARKCREELMKATKDDGAVPSPPLPVQEDLKIPWHLRFRNNLEAHFATDFRNTVRRTMTASILLVTMIYMLAWLVELRIAPEVTATTWRPRLVALMATLTIPVAAFHSRDARLQHPAIAVMALVSAASHLYMGHMVDHAFSYIYYFIVFMPILLMATLFRVTLVWAAPVSAIILLISFQALLDTGEPGSQESLVIFLWLATMSSITLYGLYFQEYQQRRLFVSEHLMSLHRSELQRANMALTSQAVEDQLTGTVNRRGMEERLRFLLQAPHTRGEANAGSIAILIFDVDDFKRYNDTYGHQRGDRTLSKVARTASEMIQRAGDFVARYGGEEFLVALQGTSPEDAIVFAERLRERIQQLGIPHASSSASDVVTISVGIAWSTLETRETSELIQRADSALYAAKAAGRNRSAIFDRDGAVRTIPGQNNG